MDKNLKQWFSHTFIETKRPVYIYIYSLQPSERNCLLLWWQASMFFFGGGGMFMWVNTMITIIAMSNVSVMNIHEIKPRHSPDWQAYSIPYMQSEYHDICLPLCVNHIIQEAVSINSWWIALPGIIWSLFSRVKQILFMKTKNKKTAIRFFPNI